MELGDATNDARELTRFVDAKLGELLLSAREQGLERVRIGLGDDGKPFMDVAD